MHARGGRIHLVGEGIVDRVKRRCTWISDAVPRPDLDRLKASMTQSVVVDLRNIYRPQEMAAAGFVYEGIGRSNTSRDG